MESGDLGEVASTETLLYDFPWSRGNFADSLAAGYDAWLFESDPAAQLIGYAIVMWLPEEVHLLNLSVHPDWQSRGHGTAMLRWLLDDATRRGARSMLLEVRPSNEVARRLYAREGFRTIGLRKRYYPAPGQTREDAIVMVWRDPEPASGRETQGG